MASYLESASATDSSSRNYGFGFGKKGTYSNVGLLNKYYKGSEIQNTKSARVYVFGDGDSAVDDENVEFEMPELKMRSRSKGSSSNFSNTLQLEEELQQPAYFIKEIADGETLQAIALKYACPVSELKRLNKLIQDQEFYGLKVLKVPMKKYGILSEEIANEAKDSKHFQHSRSATATSLTSDTEAEPYSNYFEESDSQHDFSDPETQMKIMRTLSIRDNFSSQGKDAELFLKRMDDDLKRLKQSSRHERESLSEVISVLTNKSIQPLQMSRPSDKQKGASSVVSWWTIICISVTVGIIVPLVLFLYIKYVLNNH
ncbi:unnamed protein product [Candidula unifasciata]|uniref:LysM domain-containing protein n=1 Tax=Candidula unifasciata TaxID=100452 RepID=A0A8S4A0X4_9EUPU|nr:unnamed protein product [Candidula unifasciata]